ncbi:hypothetical protein [Mitsuaria sp. PDC51]|uniref:hypothetical protein n=1 Tax=Mitsuaria sp. PDC51 TaxID=1881035 RepID=UPI00113FCA78|nr:hypothetical protein [Mitsuaria sp. PDC51]
MQAARQAALPSALPIARQPDRLANLEAVRRATVRPFAPDASIVVISLNSSEAGRILAVPDDPSA